MKKFFLIFLIAVIGLTAKSYGQGTCETALIINPTDSVQRNEIPINDSVYWVKFVATDTSIHIGMQTIYSDTNFASQITLYYAPNNCDAYTQLASINGIYLHYGNLIIGNTYLIKIHYNGSILKSSLAYYKGIDKALGKGLPDPNILPNLPNPICTGTYIPFTTDWNTTFYGIMMSVPLYSLWNNIPIGVYFYYPLPFQIYCIATNSQGTADITYQGYVTSNTQFAFSSTNCSTYNFTGSTCINPSLLNLCTFDYDYGDYTPHGTSLNTSHTYTNNSGTHNVTLCITFNPVLNPFMHPQQTWTFHECISHQVSTTILPPVQFSSTSPQTIFSGSAISITASVPGETITSWQWTSVPSGFSYNNQSITVSPTVNTTYTVIATDANGCVHIGSFVVNVVSPLTITSDWGGKPCSEQVNFTFPLPATPGITYTWILPNNATIATTTAPNAIAVNWNNAGIATISVEGRDINNILLYQGSLLVNPNQTPCTATYAINNLNATQIKALFGGASTITTTQLITINGTITINENINFDACSNIKLGLNAKINVMPGCTLNILNSTLNACDCLWDGIFVESPTAWLNIENSSVSGAKNAVVSSNDGKINLYNTIFTENNIGTWIRRYNPYIYYDFQGNPSIPSSHSAVIKKCKYERINSANIGIVIDTVYNVTIGDVSTAINTNEFKNLYRGIQITGSDVNIYNNYFNESNHTYFLTIPNYLYAEPTAASVFIKSPYYQGTAPLPHTPHPAIQDNVIIGGSATNQPNTFYKQEVGVYGFNTRVNVRNNTFIDQRFSAVHLRELNKSEINYNTITMQTNLWATNNLYNSTILTENAAPLASAAINISSNTINNTRTGINVRNCNGDGGIYSYCNILTNTVNFSTVNLSNGSYTGISASNCEYAVIESNNMSYGITPTKMNTLHEGLYGIYLSTIQNAKISSNRMRFMGDGIYIAGYSTGSQYFCNDLDKCWYGFYFNIATLSHQLLNPIGNNTTSDNYWYDITHSTTAALRRMEGNLATAATPINWKHRAVTNDVDNIYSPYILQYDYFDQRIVPVQNQAANANCYAWFVMNPVGREALLGNIVTDNMNYEILPDENEYIGKEFAYKQLDKDPASLNMLVPEDVVYQQFYTTTKAGNIGKNDEVNKAINNKNYATARNINAGIVPQNTIESNRKTVQGVYLEKLVNNQTLPVSDSLTLLAIAMQTPYAGGDAVYAARVILGIDPLQYNLAYAKPPTHQPIAAADKVEIKAYPNPANNALFVELTNEMQGNILLEIFDINGKLAFTQILNAKQKNQNIDISSVKKGIYNLRIRANNDIVKYQKLVIIK